MDRKKRAGNIKSRRRMDLSSTSIENITEDHITFTSTIGDIMYMHQAMRQSMRLMRCSHIKKLQLWKMIWIEEVPPNTKIQDLVLEMRRKE